MRPLSPHACRIVAIGVRSESCEGSVLGGDHVMLRERVSRRGQTPPRSGHRSQPPRRRATHHHGTASPPQVAVLERGLPDAVPTGHCDDQGLCRASSDHKSFFSHSSPLLCTSLCHCCVHLPLRYVSRHRGEAPAALSHARRGLELLLEWGTAWDKRLSWDAWAAWTRVMLQTAEAGEGLSTRAFGILNLGMVKDLENARSGVDSK